MDAVQPNEIVPKKYFKMNEALPRLQSVLEDALGKEGTKRLCTLLQQTGGLIAGGCVLRAHQNPTENNNDDNDKQDIDIYIPVKNAKAF